MCVFIIFLVFVFGRKKFYCDKETFKKKKQWSIYKYYIFLKTLHDVSRTRIYLSVFIYRDICQFI